MFFFLFQYLFEKAAVSMVAASASASELKELRHLYDEAVKNTAQLEEDISQVILVKWLRQEAGLSNAILNTNIKKVQLMLTNGHFIQQ